MSKNILFKNEDIFDNKHFNIGQDWETPIPAFFILRTKRNIHSIADLTNEESLEFITILRKVRIGMKKILKIKNIYLFQNEDAKSGFHIWIFPRYDWMEEFGRKIQSVRPIMDYAEKNLVNESMIKEVKDSVQKMQEFMNR